MSKNRSSSRKNEMNEKPEVRRIGFDFPVKVLNEFRAAICMRNEPSLTHVLTQLMDAYSEKVRKEKGLDSLCD